MREGRPLPSPFGSPGPRVATPGPSASELTGLTGLIANSLARRFPPAVANCDDNVGLTISTLRDVERGAAAVVMLCVDLTEQVLAEAINGHANHVITYSPTPNTPLRVLSADDVVGRIALRCATNSIAVHSIHSACANAAGGMSDWLASSLAPGTVVPIVPHPEFAGAGEGRMLEADRALPLSALVLKLKELLQLKHLRLAFGVSADESDLQKAQECCFVKSVAVHAGEGAEVLRHAAANVYVTSEMAHADVIAANAQGVVVILTGQSTMERAYLRSLRQDLHDEFSRSDWNVRVKCSQVDCNPLSIV